MKDLILPNLVLCMMEFLDKTSKQYKVPNFKEELSRVVDSFENKIYELQDTIYQMQDKHYSHAQELQQSIDKKQSLCYNKIEYLIDRVNLSANAKDNILQHLCAKKENMEQSMSMIKEKIITPPTKLTPMNRLPLQTLANERNEPPNHPENNVKSDNSSIHLRHSFTMDVYSSY